MDRYTNADVEALVEGAIPQRRVLDLAPGICGFDGAVNWKTRPDDQHGLWTLAPEWRTSRPGKRDANAVRHDGPVDLVPWVLVLGTLLVQAGDLRAHTVSTFADQSASFA